MGQETTQRRQLCDTASGYQHILSGRLIPIGLASPKRIAGFNTVPTLAEQGLKGFEAYAWQGLVVPARRPGPSPQLPKTQATGGTKIIAAPGAASLG